MEMKFASIGEYLCMTDVSHHLIPETYAINRAGVLPIESVRGIPKMNIWNHISVCDISTHILMNIAEPFIEHFIHIKEKSDLMVNE